MPLFGLFRDKKSNGTTNATSNTSAASELDNASLWESVSQTTHSHDDEDTVTPSSNNRIKIIPFRRKISDIPPVAPPQQASLPKRPPRAPRPPVSSSVIDVTERSRPSRMPVALASYDESQRLSSRSLPATSRTAPDPHSYQDMLDPQHENTSKPKKSGGLLSWARERTRSKPSSPLAPPTESFNLRAFRHVARTESPSVQLERPPSDYSLEPPPARPRPRGDSVASDSSQRISVVAFREAQSRRSATNSPVPSFRPPSAADTLAARALTPTRSTPQTSRTQVNSRKSMALSMNTSSSSSSSEEESDDETLHIGRRKRTITRRPARAQTDIGHSQDNDGLQSSSLKVQAMAPQPRSASPQVVGGGNHPSSTMTSYAKSRASVSTSVLESTKRPMVDFPNKPASKKKYFSDSDSSSNSSSDADSDDAPLASLVGPRRPGSAMSGASNSRLRVPTKPLIDITTLVTDRTVLSSSPEPQIASSLRLPDKGKGEEVERDDVTGLATLAALARQAEAEEQRETNRETMPPPPLPSAKVAQPQPKLALGRPSFPVFSKSHHRRMSSDAVTAVTPREDLPPRSVSRGPEMSVVHARSFATLSPEPSDPVRIVSPESNSVDDDDIMPALRFMMPETYDDDNSPAPKRTQVVEASSSALPEEQRIVPTPIRQRLPPSSFAVTSRPQHRPLQSTNSVLSNSSSSTSTSTLTSTTITPKPTYPTAPTSTASFANQNVSPRVERPRSSSLAMSMDQHSASSSPSPFVLPSLPTAPTSTNKSTPTVKSSASSNSKSETLSGLTQRTRSGYNTLISQIPDSPPMNPNTRPQSVASSNNFVRPDSLVARMPPSAMKVKSFAGSANRRESPTSSTGDSSSGRLPLTPGDGSDFGGSKSSWDKMDSGLQKRGHGRKGHMKKRSVSFDEDVNFERGRDKGIVRERERVEKIETAMESENRRRDRRRSEAKAAIELGNVINGRGPIDDSDEDNNDLVRHNVVPQFNPMMPMGASTMNFSQSAGPPVWNPWQQQGPPSAGLMPPLPNQFGQDAHFLAAHRQAMMIAKQTYQMAVAQQALAAAGDEWERSSNISGFGGNQGFGGVNPGFGGPNMNVNMGMFGMGGGMGGYGNGMGMPNGWPNGSLMVPSGPHSVYGGSFGATQSEYGGVAGGGWGTKSVYGESFGPSPGNRTSKAFSAVPQGRQQANFQPSKGNRERGNDPSGHSNRADGGGSSSGQQHSRSAPRPRTLTAPSGSPPVVKTRRPSPPPSSFRRYNAA